MSEDLEDSLRAGGSKVSEGTFKVDARRALAKLREYRLAEPHAWVLEILRAAAFSGARTVEVETDADDVKVTFGGKAFPPEVMNDLLAQALDSKGAGAARYLSLGIAGALGLEPKWIRARSGGVSLEIVPPDTVKTLESKDGDAGTFVHVRKRFGWDVIKATIAETSPEETAIFANARAYGPKLTHNKKAVNGDRFPGGLIASAEFENGDMHVIVGLPAKAKHGQLVFDVGGVVVARREYDLPGRYLVAWARCDAMRRNASGSDVVDADPNVEKVRAKVDALATELIGKLGGTLGDLPAVWRRRFRAYALELVKYPKLHPSIRSAVRKLPLIPGLYDEWNSQADFQVEKDAGRPVYFTTESFPRGSYPKPIVKLGAEVHDPLDPLLPPGAKRADAAKLVQRRIRAAEHKARWLESPIEPATLPVARYDAKADIATPTLTGQVGLVPNANAGAFVRLLCQGRFLQQGQVTTLAPLRLRAVIDTKTEVTEAHWAEVPSDKLLRSVVGAIAAAAERAVLAGLGPDFTKPPEAGHEDHAFDLLKRYANQGSSLAKLPEGLELCPLFECTDGNRVSLKALKPRGVWHFVREWSTDALLSGEPVLILPDRELREALGKLAPKRLKDASDRLQEEREVRKRIDGPRHEARLDARHRAVVRFVEDGLTGEVAIPREIENGINLRLLRDGVLLERNRISELGDCAIAIFDSKHFAPDEQWETAARDDTYTRVLQAIRAALERLPALVVKEYAVPFRDLDRGLARFLIAFMRKHLAPGSDPHPSAEAVAAAPLFWTNRGRRSLVQLRQEGEIWHLPEDEQGERDCDDLFVVFAPPEHVALLGALRGDPVPDATPELQRRQRRRQYLVRPEARLELGEGVLLPVTVAGDGVKGLIGFVDQASAGTALTLLVENRVFTSERFLSNLSMGGMLAIDGVDPAEPELPAAQRAAVHAVLPDTERRIIERAVVAPELPGARKILLLALGAKLEKTFPRDVADALLDVKLFACTDGVHRSARALETSKRVLFVGMQMEGVPASKEPVVVVLDALTRSVLTRWTSENVTETLTQELQARAARERLPEWEAIVLREAAVWKRAFEGRDVEGEVGVVSHGGGRVTLLQGRRPLGVIEGALPVPLAAVVNCDALQAASLGQGVAMDGTYDAVLATVTEEAFALLDTAADVIAGSSDDQKRALGGLVAPLAHWLVEKKQRSAKLVKAAVFETTGRKLISLSQILDENKKHRSVLWSKERGEALNDDRWIWRPRHGEDALLRSQINLKDATAAILRAQEVRGREKVAHLRAPVPGEWREPLSGKTEGEVVLRDRPTGLLVVELHKDRVLLEEVSSEHVIGGVACASSDAIAANSDWTKANRNLAFKRVMVDVEDALERLVARRLAHRDVFWRDFAEAALKWKPENGPLASAINGLPLFYDLRNRERTVGEVLEQYARHARVLVAKAGMPAPADREVFVLNERSEALFTLLAVKTEDIGPLLQKKEELAAALRARRLASLKHAGTPVARLDVHGEGFRGELVLLDPGDKPEVVLAKDGIRVCTRTIAGDLPVGGVVDVDDLIVDDEWAKGELPKPVAEALASFVEPLFALLAASVPRLDPAGRARARIPALTFIAGAGVSAPRHLERMKGAAAALAAAPLFLTEEGLWVALTALADQAITKGWVSVFEQSWRKRDTGGELVLRAATLKDPWISSLEKVFGPSCIERVRDVALWRGQLAERDPASSTAEGVGIGRLRAQMKLLRAGALGHVTPDELEDVRLRKGGAPGPITYDARRKLAVLDGDDPAIARALAEISTRPERVYVLLAAIYGAVNRALVRVTDEDEAELLAAMSKHLAANPKLLRPDPK